MKKIFLVFWMSVLSSVFAISQSVIPENIHYKQFGAICDIYVRSNDYYEANAEPSDTVSEVIMLEPSIAYRMAQYIENTELVIVSSQVHLFKDSVGVFHFDLGRIGLYKNGKGIGGVESVYNPVLMKKLKGIFKDTKVRSLLSRDGYNHFWFTLSVRNLKVKKDDDDKK